MNHHAIHRYQVPLCGKALPVLISLLLFSAGGFSQGGPKGAIAGTVKDTTGGALPGATVEIINEATEVSERSVLEYR